VKRYGYPAFQHPSIAVAEAEVPDRLIGEPPLFEIRVIRIERPEVEIQSRIHDNPGIRCLRLSLLGRNAPAQEDIPDLEGRLPQFLRIVGIESLHPAAEVQHIALGMAAETLPDAALNVDRERRGFPLPLMSGQRAVAGSPLALDVQLDVVMGEDFGESQQCPKLLEINPCSVP